MSVVLCRIVMDSDRLDLRRWVYDLSSRTRICFQELTFSFSIITRKSYFKTDFTISKQTTVYEYRTLLYSFQLYPEVASSSSLRNNNTVFDTLCHLYGVQRALDPAPSRAGPLGWPSSPSGCSLLSIAAERFSTGSITPGEVDRLARNISSAFHGPWILLQFAIILLINVLFISLFTFESVFFFPVLIHSLSTYWSFRLDYCKRSVYFIEFCSCIQECINHLLIC